jgi:hypothetical protein
MGVRSDGRDSVADASADGGGAQGRDCLWCVAAGLPFSSGTPPLATHGDHSRTPVSAGRRPVDLQGATGKLKALTLAEDAAQFTRYNRLLALKRWAAAPVRFSWNQVSAGQGICFSSTDIS